jgi:uncharacterized repeat protein (TIGR01451 family)/MYXO-CTERM domain-containing protein
MNRGLMVSCVVFVTLLASAAAAQPALRVQVDQNGDFAVIGNTLGWDCGANPPAPVVGTVPGGGACGSSSADSAPDVHWRSDDANATAAANTTITAAQARSTAVLALPPGSTITHAFLYWGAKAAAADASVTFDKMGAAGVVAATLDPVALPADQFTIPSGGNLFYQSVADVTAFVQAQGEGAYRISGVDALNFVNLNDTTDFAAWTLVVLYQNAADPPRNLVIFDGLDQVSNGNPASATLSGFVVPLAGYDAKLAVVTYEGDASLTGDALRFGLAPLTPADELSDALNPSNNFFNATRSLLGAAVSIPGDLPQLTGTASSMGGYDLDVVDITARVAPGQTSADIQATSSSDLYLLGVFVTSISTFKPDLSTSGKTVQDVNGGSLLPGEQLSFTITAANSGNDNAANVVLTDPLPMGVSFVPGSINISAGANMGMKTDAAGDDQAEYDAGTHTLIARLGTGADATTGGTIGVGESTTLTFLVTVNPDAMGTIVNQALIDFEGEQGSPPDTAPTDGNGNDPGAPPTQIEINECNTDADCTDPAKPACDTAPTPHICVECVTDAHCSEPTPVCDVTAQECVECVDDDDCAGNNSVCETTSQTCTCDPVAGGEVCGNDVDEDCDGVLDNGCGGQPCTSDAECIGPPNDGIVCDVAGSGTCVPGCRGEGADAGCPDEAQSCTSADASLGECVDSGIYNAQGGCGCGLSQRDPSRAWIALLSLCAALGLRRRRR